MDVKEAVAIAKRHIVELFADERPTNLGLEEVELDPQKDQWIITLGFSRPWDVPHNALAAIGASGPRRDYKVVRISDSTGQIVSVKNRETVT